MKQPFLDSQARVIVQGMTGRFGDTLTQAMLHYGTVVVAGVTPGKGGEWFHGLPIFDNVFRAVEATGARVSLVTVPPDYACDAIYEAINAGIETIVCITEQIPVGEVMRVIHHAQSRGVRLLGPGSAGIMIVGESVIGLIPTQITLRGGIGIAARGGSLLYHVSSFLQRGNLGMSVLLSAGSDLMGGMTTPDLLEQLEEDPNTEQIVLLTDIDGSDIEAAAGYIRGHVTKPTVAMVAGRYLPHRVSFVRRGLPTQDGAVLTAIRALESAGVRLADYPEQLIPLLLNRAE